MQNFDQSLLDLEHVARQIEPIRQRFVDARVAETLGDAASLARLISNILAGPDALEYMSYYREAMQRCDLAEIDAMHRAAATIAAEHAWNEHLTGRRAAATRTNFL